MRQNLFFALINDENDMLQNIGVDEFIERYKKTQLDISIIPEDDPYSDSHDPYDFVTHDVIEDGCPDGWLLGDNSSDEESYDW
jgi:hypothetical protein